MVIDKIYIYKIYYKEDKWYINDIIIQQNLILTLILYITIHSIWVIKINKTITVIIQALQFKICTMKHARNHVLQFRNLQNNFQMYLLIRYSI